MCLTILLNLIRMVIRHFWPQVSFYRKVEGPTLGLLQDNLHPYELSSWFLPSRGRKIPCLKSKFSIILKNGVICDIHRTLTVEDVSNWLSFLKYIFHNKMVPESAFPFIAQSITVSDQSRWLTPLFLCERIILTLAFEVHCLDC